MRSGRARRPHEAKDGCVRTTSATSAAGHRVRAALVAMLVLAAGGATAVGVVLADSASPVTGTAGTAFSGPVATFDNPCTCDTPTIDWGDGVTGTGTAQLDTNTNEVVSAAHAYAQAGSFVPTVTLRSHILTTTVTRTQTTSARIADAALEVSPQSGVSAVAGSALNAFVATFSYANPAAGSPSQFSAQIDWGDGAASAGTVSATTAQHFVVSGSHTYAHPGPHTITTRVTDIAVHHAIPNDAITGATGQASEAIVVSAPPATFDVHIDVPFAHKLLSDAPFTLGVNGSASTGPLTYEWDFGDHPGQVWTDSDLADPAQQPFAADLGGPSVAHTFKAVIQPGGFYQALDTPPDEDGESGAASPANAGEVRRTYLVRVRATDPYGSSKIVGVPVVVLPDAPPRPQFEGFSYEGYDADVDFPNHLLCEHRAPNGTQASGTGVCSPQLEYADTDFFDSLSIDPDNIRDAADTGGRDRIVREHWHFSDGTDVDRPAPDCPQVPASGGDAAQSAFADCERDAAVLHNWFGAARPAGVGPLTSYSVNGTGEDARKDLEARVAAMHSDGTAFTDAGDRQVTLTLTDRSGRSRAKTQSFSFRPWRRPNPNIDVTGATAASGGGQELATPITSDTVPGDGSGTKITLDLSGSAADERGEIAYHVLQIGIPNPKPCTAPKRSDCKSIPTPALASVDKTIVVRDSATVSLTFPHPSGDEPWSILDTAYDQTGARGTARYDGFKVVAPGQKCSEIDGQSLGDLVFSGSCVDTNTAGNVFWTQRPIDINGARLRAAGGGYTVVAQCSGKQRILATPDEPTAATSCNHFVTAPIKGTQPAKVGPLQLLAGDAPVVSLSGNEQSDLTNPGPHSYDPSNGAQYQSFDVAGKVSLELDGKVGGVRAGTSSIDFQVAMPAIFKPDGGGAVTAATHLPAKHPSHAVIVKRYDGLASAAAASAAPLRVRAADAGGGSTPPTSITMQTPADLGGIPLPSGLPVKFTYDAQSGVFTGDASADVLDGFGPSVQLHIVLRHGDFESATGTVNATVPVGPILLTGFSFTIGSIPNPQGGKTTQLQARVHFTDATSALIDGTGTITQEFEPFHLAIDADATLLHLLPVHAGLDFTGSGFGFHASVNKSFGPASLAASLDGVFASEGFQISGTGRACLFVCLKVQGLASDQAIAGCGSLDLLFTTLEAGFGYRFANHDLDVWSGSCDLSHYGSAADLGLRAVQPTIGLGPSFAMQAQSFTIPTAKARAALSIVVAPATQLLSVVGAPPPVTVGPTPQIRVLDPAGRLVAQTSPILGNFFQYPKTFSDPAHPKDPDPTSGAIVDQDSASGVTRVLIPHPSEDPRPYTVVRIGGDAIAPPRYAYSDPPVNAKLFDTIVVGAAPTGTTHDVKTGRTLVAGHLPGTQSLHATAAQAAAVGPATNPPATDPAQPQIAGATLPLIYKQPVVAKATKLTRAGTIVPQLLTTYDYTALLQLKFAGKLPPGETITFVEAGPGTHNEIGVAEANVKGRFGGTFTFVPGSIDDRFFGESGQPIHRHCIDAYVSDQLKLPRGVVHDLACFLYKPPPRIDPPSLVAVNNDYQAGTISLDPNQLVELGGEAQFGVSLQDGLQDRSFLVSADSIAKLQAGHTARGTVRAARSARFVAARIAATPVAKRSFRFKIRGLPKGRHRIKITIFGVRGRGDKRKVGRATITLKPGQRKAKIHFHRAGGRRR
jgi:hypothetical protein